MLTALNIGYNFVPATVILLVKAKIYKIRRWIIGRSLHTKKKGSYVEVTSIRLFVCDLVSAPILLDKFSSNSTCKVSQHVPGKFLLSFVLIHLLHKAINRFSHDPMKCFTNTAFEYEKFPPQFVRQFLFTY
jgi:hypothetical protein